ncbi:hypothetical protein KHA80_03235 [Anaerobacillus sp. HL2]|nr:hypothetical protein KHA80_03235 [Anaerobacillus sp. HL2]
MSDIELKSDNLIVRAAQVQASDIHIIPANRYSNIQFRVDHRLITVEKIKNSDAEKLISHFNFVQKWI